MVGVYVDKEGSQESFMVAASFNNECPLLI